MKKVGKVLFCFIPFLLAFGIQILTSVPFMGITFAYTFLHIGASATSIWDIIEPATTIWTSSSFNILLSACYGCAALAVFAFWYYKKFRHTDSLSIPRAFTPTIIISIVAIAIGLQYVTNYIVTFVAFLRPDWLASYESLLKSIDISHVSPVLAAYSVLIAPICEELIFRGVTLSYAKRVMPFGVANILQASLFGLYHMNWLQGIYAFFIGIFLGYVCYKGGSIFLSIFLHACFNLWGTFAPENFMYKSDILVFFIFWLVFGLVCLYLGLFGYSKGLAIRNTNSFPKVNDLPNSSDM